MFQVLVPAALKALKSDWAQHEGGWGARDGVVRGIRKWWDQVIFGNRIHEMG